MELAIATQASLATIAAENIAPMNALAMENALLETVYATKATCPAIAQSFVARQIVITTATATTGRAFAFQGSLVLTVHSPTA